MPIRTNQLMVLDDTIKTIASGVVTVTQMYHAAAAESGTADDLVTITLDTDAFPVTDGANTFRPFVIIWADAGDTITVKHGTGNIYLNGTSDYALSGNKQLLLFFNGTNWTDLAGTNIASGTIGGSSGATDDRLIRADGTGGSTIQSSGVTLDDSANMSGVNSIATVQIRDTNGNEEIIFTTTASAVNELTITNAATGNNPAVAATGDDTNIGVNLNPKGTGAVTVNGKQLIDGNADAVQLRVQANGSQSAYLATFEDSAGNVQVAISGNGDVIINEEGNDANFRVETDGNANALFVDGGSNNVGIGTATPDEDVMLDVVSTTKASRPFPTMDSTQRDAIATPATASIIYNSTTTQYEYWDGAAWQPMDSGGGGTVPVLARNGLPVQKLTNAILEVGIGNITVESTVVNVTTPVSLNMGTAGDWIGGSSLESNSEFANIYIDAAGNIKLYDKLPNYPRADTGSRVAFMRVNQAGWDGTAAQGLNATAIIYDTDTGEGSIAVGMLLGVYSDSTYETGRGRGSGAAASVNNASFALITAIDTGTNTVTVEAGHNIAINDDDYLIVISYGALEYINVSATWWRLVGRMYNDGSGNLNDNQMGDFALYLANEGSDYTTSSTSFVAVDATNFTLSALFSGAGNLLSGFNGVVGVSAFMIYFTITLDGVAVAGDDGLVGTFYNQGSATFTYLSKKLLPGTHVIQLQWKVASSTGTLFAGAGTSGLDFHPEFYIREVN